MILKQIFIINKDLGMTKGKIVAQALHGGVKYMEIMGEYNSLTVIDDKESQMITNYANWVKDGLMKKVVLKATREEMLILIGILEMLDDKIWFNIVFDKGLTQVPVDSMTCIVVEPLDEEMADHYFGHLKLL